MSDAAASSTRPGRPAPVGNSSSRAIEPTSCPAVLPRLSSRTPRLRTSRAASTMNAIPIGPDRYSHHCSGSGAGATVPTSVNRATTSSSSPAEKLTRVAVHAEPACWATCPLTACCAEVPTPTTSDSTTTSTNAATPDASPGPPVRLLHTLTATPTTASRQPSTRRAVKGRAPLGESPRRSTSRLPPVSPATTATVKTATPSTGTATPWATTKAAPPIPPTVCHHRSRPSRREASRRRRPRRPAGRQQRPEEQRRPADAERQERPRRSRPRPGRWPVRASRRRPRGRRRRRARR